MNYGIYNLNNPESLDTPTMLTYPHLVNKNIDEIIKICGSPSNLVPHAKTHKSPDILKMQIERGIRSFKCATLKEVEMVALNGGLEIVMAYPLIHPIKLARFTHLVDSHPEIKFSAIASTSEHLKELNKAVSNIGRKVGVYMDLDSGMRRTGVQPGSEAVNFYLSIADTEFLTPVGVHVFDGETTYVTSAEERKSMASNTIKEMESIWVKSESEGIPVTDNLAGGSWSFFYYANHPNIRPTPGTWIYWDTRNAEMGELPFEIASLILGQVVDRDPEMDTVTVDIGSKACSSDQPLEHRFRIIGYDKAILILQSEEHGVIKLNGAKMEVGDFVLAAPGHACTMTVKFPSTNIVDQEGNIRGKFIHSARDR